MTNICGHKALCTLQRHSSMALQLCMLTLFICSMAFVQLKQVAVLSGGGILLLPHLPRIILALNHMVQLMPSTATSNSSTAAGNSSGVQSSAVSGINAVVNTVQSDVNCHCSTASAASTDAAATSAGANGKAAANTHNATAEITDSISSSDGVTGATTADTETVIKKAVWRSNRALQQQSQLSQRMQSTLAAGSSSSNSSISNSNISSSNTGSSDSGAVNSTDSGAIARCRTVSTAVTAARLQVSSALQLVEHADPIKVTRSN
jgi:hypothetical protein